MKDNDTKFELIEKYFDGRLTTTEQATFDHLLANNQEFAQDVSDYRKITAFTDFLDDKILLKDIDITNRQTTKSKTASTYQLKANAPVNSKGQRAIISPVFLPSKVNTRYAAAVIMFLVGTVVVSLMFSHLNLDKNNVAVKKQPRSLTVTHEVPVGGKISNGTAQEENISTTKQPKEMSSNYLADNFKLNETLERHIDKYARSIEDRGTNQSTLFKMINPPKKVNNLLKIKWESTDAAIKNIVVKVFNNQNKQVLDTYTFPSNSGNTELNTATLTQGLYYWRVIDEETEKVLFTGKFTKGGK